VAEDWVAAAAEGGASFAVGARRDVEERAICLVCVRYLPCLLAARFLVGSVRLDGSSRHGSSG
jgi:hypothetical protein